jgi:hypothetical protein
MLTRALALSVALMLLGAAVLAGPPAKHKKTAAKTIEVKVCPIEMEAVMGKGGGQEVVGNYTVHFCCAGCKPTFDKLSKTDKMKKIAAALKKQNAAKKGKGKTTEITRPRLIRITA